MGNTKKDESQDCCEIRLSVADYDKNNHLKVNVQKDKRSKFIKMFEAFVCKPKIDLVEDYE
ncbi:hypothetical protein EHP00_69 [Ecytonucleospora hepatopenaei]|uniref:Uncharacterized protein n=1 Tax=Ecytonucleospora hepatopenaei TaxID=646526 RepID=A0A1W0E5N7_9MICR|nr:hypothetical protein EHP00_69 [Ecytonucleospora hepatopenaei]